MWNHEWTQLAGYLLAAMTVEPDRIVFELHEPKGKPPVRIQLLEPSSNNLPPSLAVAGTAIAEVVMTRRADGEEAITIELIDGALLSASCSQIRVDVS